MARNLLVYIIGNRIFLEKSKSVERRRRRATGLLLAETIIITPGQCARRAAKGNDKKNPLLAAFLIYWIEMKDYQFFTTLILRKGGTRWGDKTIKSNAYLSF